VGPVARRFRRCLVMPNLTPPVVTTEQALAYRHRILKALELDRKKNPSSPVIGFEPLMSLYLTDKTTPDEIRKARASGHVYAVKLYPAGATTNSDSGVTDIKKLYPTLSVLTELKMPLLIHGEVTDQQIDLFDREKEFIHRHLIPLIKALPNLRIVLEHVTTEDAVNFVLSAGENIAATITAHHLLYNRSDIFKGGLNPHLYCLPVLKRERHRLALLRAATSGNPKFFLGTDSAPHPRHKKEATCGSAGCYTGFAALELYVEAFDQVNALDKLESFASRYGALFYGIPINATQTNERVSLMRKKWTVPSLLPLGKNEVVPLRAGQTIPWELNSPIPSKL